MYSLKTLAAALVASTLVSTSAFAVTITNRDASPRMVIIEKSSVPADVDAQWFETDHLVPGRKSVNQMCQERCSARLAGSSDKVTLSQNDNLVINKGKLSKVAK